MAEKRKKQTNKQVNKNKPNLSTIKNSQKTLGYTFGYSLCFRADNSPALPLPHPQIQIMNRPDKKTQHSTFPKRIAVRCNIVRTVTSTTKNHRCKRTVGFGMT